MDKQKKLKFNIVDVIFLLVVLAGIVFLAVRVGGLGSGSTPGNVGLPSPSRTYRITFYSESTADYVTDRVELGERITTEYFNNDLGTVSDFRLLPAQVSSAAADGRVVISDKEGYHAVLVSCEVPGTDKDGFAVTVDGLDLSVGHSMVIRVEDAKLWVVVYDIQELSGPSGADQ